MRERARTVRVAAVLAIPLLLGSSCTKEAASPTWDVDAVVPLVNTSLGLGDLIADSLLTTDADGNVSILYSTRLFALKLDTILAVPDTNFRYKYPPFDLGGASLNIFPNTTLNATNEVTRFDLDELALRELRVRSGEVGIQVYNRLGTAVIGSFTLGGASLNNVPFALQVTAPAGTAVSPSLIQTSQDLAGYVFDLRGPQYDAVNSLATSISYTSDPNGTTVQMTNADSLEAVVYYKDIVPQYARGYFGTRAIDLDPDSSRLDVFENLSGALDIDQATATLTLRNGVGVDARAWIERLHAVNTRNGAVVPLQHTITSSPVNLDRAVDLGNTYQAAVNTFTLTTSNSNLGPFIEALPDRIAYDTRLLIDPLGDVGNGNDFFYYDSDLSADLDIDLPLRLIASDLQLSRITTVSLPGTAANHAIQSGTLHFFATNGFPFSATARLELLDVHDQVMAVLLPSGTITSANLGADGAVTSAAYSQVDVVLSSAQVEQLYLNGRLRITARFNTASQTEHVRLRAEQRLDVQVTFEGNYLVNGDE